MKIKYYDISEDINKYNNAWCFIVVGGRSTGKTYSALKYCYEHHHKFVFIKRTIDDVKLLCGGVKSEYAIDLSPFKPINRDIGSNVKAILISDKGIGAFYKFSGEDKGELVGYILALNAVTKFKGFDMSDADFIIFDEFIPQPWERINRKEGEQLLDLYKTVARDREQRGKKPLKLLCLANATSISNPTTNILEVTDIIADMGINNTDILYIENRGILLHIIESDDSFLSIEKQSGIYKAMEGTAWARVSFDNDFAYDDMTNIGHMSLKNFVPRYALMYKQMIIYVYQKSDMYYLTESRSNRVKIYNLNRETEQRLYFNEEYQDLYEACINDKVVFDKYSMYDLIINYKKCFKI